MTRIAIGMGIAAALIPVSMLIGLTAAQSVIVSVLVGIVFIGFAKAMSTLFPK